MGIFSALLGNAGVVAPEKLAKDYAPLLADDEAIEGGFKLIRDTVIFTSRRLILVDVQGVTGRKTEYLSIPYSQITKFSVETHGHFDLDAELKLWIVSDPDPLERKFNRSVNIYDVQKVLASHVQ